MGDEGDEGDEGAGGAGSREQGAREKSFPLCTPHPAPLPLCNSQCPIPNALFPMPYSQCPINQ
ncbi:MAG: hypothetical protein V7L23_03865 [Nostoc sp.]|uniref:hypothetical protein n=1 Tax=Nostoc sp. TaxID=1180 RepID=UPI002FF1BA83